MEWVIKYWVEWAFGIIAALLGMAYRSIAKWRKVKTAEDAAIRAGVVALLHDSLYNSCYTALTRGYVEPQERGNIEMVYRAYHDLGGNGSGTALWERVQTLKIKSV